MVVASEASVADIVIAVAVVVVVVVAGSWNGCQPANSSTAATETGFVAGLGRSKEAIQPHTPVVVPVEFFVCLLAHDLHKRREFDVHAALHLIIRLLLLLLLLVNTSRRYGLDKAFITIIIRAKLGVVHRL